MADCTGTLRPSRTIIFISAVSLFAALAILRHLTALREPVPVLARQTRLLAQCEQLRVPAGPPVNFREQRQFSDRYERDTPPTLIVNASIWTGSHNGTQVVLGDIFLDKGVVKALGHVPRRLLSNTVKIINVQGSWVTPGLGAFSFWLEVRRDALHRAGTYD